jgi:D-alanyl-D-alanine carboxypeptidase
MLLKRMCQLTLAISALSFAASAAAAPSNTDLLHQWLATYNEGDPKALSAFKRAVVGEADVAYWLDTREESGGFDLDRIEKDEPLQLTAIVRERQFPSPWRVTLKRERARSPKLRSIGLIALPLSQTEAIAALDSFATRLAAVDKFSGVVEMTRHGQVLYAKAFGLADRSRHTAITLDTPFLFASQGKMFTAVAVLQLVAAGKVALDDPIGKVLTDYPNRQVATQVTVRQLLTHRGGTGEMGLLEPGDSANRATVRSIADIIQLNGSRAPAFEPGTQFAYSNYGYVLLGALVERISGETYYDHVREHILKPAGMKHTSHPLREQMTGVAAGYTNAFPGDHSLRDSTDQLPWRGTPAGGGVSTAGDMVLFLQALNQGKLIPPTLLAEATQKNQDNYGYGFMSSGVGDFPYWGHGGGALGNSPVLSYYPTTDTSFVCKSNRDPPVCDRLAFNDFQSAAGTLDSLLGRIQTGEKARRGNFHRAPDRLAVVS